MYMKKIGMRIGLLGILIAFITSAVMLVSCAAIDTKGDANKTEDAIARNVTPTTRGPAQMWADNCMRCHNMRLPNSYTDAQWDVAVHHMRVRAGLTAEEHRNILQFLKNGN